MKLPLTHFIKEEKQGIKDYEDSARSSHPVERRAYKRILPEEKKHLKILKVAKRMKC